MKEYKNTSKEELAKQVTDSYLFCPGCDNNLHQSLALTESKHKCEKTGEKYTVEI